MRVLHSVKCPDDRTNPFAELLVEGLPQTVESEWFSWREALLGSYEVLHFQWPENFVRSGSQLKSVAKTAGLLLLLARLRVMRIPLVVTHHNLTPHETVAGWKRRCLQMLYHQAEVIVLLNDAVRVAPARRGQKQAVVLHGDYSDRYRFDPDVRIDENLVLYFGGIRAYKGVPGLIRAFGEARREDPTIGLRIIGKPWDDMTRAEIESALFGATNATALLDELDESALVREIGRAGLVVLPYTKMYNSGAVLLALTLSVPVLVPSTPTTQDLRREFGDQWIQLYEGVLTGTELTAALRTAGDLDRAVGPDLSRRKWRALGEQYEEVYRRAIADSRRRSRRSSMADAGASV